MSQIELMCSVKGCTWQTFDAVWSSMTVKMWVKFLGTSYNFWPSNPGVQFAFGRKATIKKKRKKKNNTKRHNPALSNQCNILTAKHFFLTRTLSVLFMGANTHHPIRIMRYLNQNIPLDLNCDERPLSYSSVCNSYMWHFSFSRFSHL